MNNSYCILGAILIIILALGFINNSNFSKTYDKIMTNTFIKQKNEGFLVENMQFKLSASNPLDKNPSLEEETPIRDRIVYEGASTPFTPVGTVLSNDTGSFIYE